MRLTLILMCLVASAATATAAPFSIGIPTGWKDTTYSSPEVDGLKARLETTLTRAQVQHYTAPDGTTVLVTFVEAYDHVPSRALLDTFERDARETTGNEVSYRATDDDTVRTIVQVSERDGKQVHARRQAGFVHGALRSAGAACTGAPATCDPVLASLTLDAAGFAKLADLRENPPPPRSKSTKLDPFELGMRFGFIVGVPGILGFLLYKRWRKDRSPTALR